MVLCKICSGQFDASQDSIVLCEHKEGTVHLGCCVDSCSWDKKPCKHSVGVYEKIS